MQQYAQQGQPRDNLERRVIKAEDHNQEQREGGDGIEPRESVKTTGEVRDPPIQTGDKHTDHGSPFPYRSVVMSVARTILLVGSKLAFQYSMARVQSGTSAGG